MGRGPRDPAAPKSATSAQQFFNKARRELLRKKNPDISSADLQKKLAEEWRDLPPNKRAPYMRMASTDKERYVEESAGYVPDPAHLKATKGGKRFQKDPLRPKKPKSAYLYFGEATRAELSGANPGIRIETLSKLIGEEWRKLNDAQKRPYVAQAEADQERYKTEMADYQPSDAYLAARDAFKLAKKRGGAGGSMGNPIELELENAALKKTIAEQEKQIAKQAKQIETLQAKKEKREAKAQDGPPAKKAKTAPTKAELPTDEAHYYTWLKKIVGAKGDKADEEMTSTLVEKGEKGLVRLLAKKYKAEH